MLSPTKTKKFGLYISPTALCKNHGKNINIQGHALGLLMYKQSILNDQISHMELKVMKNESDFLVLQQCQQRSSLLTNCASSNVPYSGSCKYVYDRVI